MKLLVCVKQVADPESNFKINNNSSWIDENSNIAFRMNRYDEYALEEALLIKDFMPDVIVDVISVGPDRTISTLKKSLEKGADRGVHIKCGNPALSAMVTSSLIAEYACDKNYDIIFAGVMSEDLMQSQVGPMIASLLSIPCAVSVVKSMFIKNFTTISSDLELEGGVIENIEITMPCVLTIQTGINRPRYPSLSNVLRARSMDIISIDRESFKIKNWHDEITSVEYLPLSSKGIVINGNIEEKAEKLLDLLHERALI